MLDVVYLAVLLVLAVLIIVRALNKKDVLVVVLPLALGSFVIIFYAQWGGWSLWHHEQDKKAKSEQVQAILKQFKTPDVLIDKLKKKLHETPESARGWYLLGRLYASQHDWSAAHGAFQQAIELNPNQESYLTNDIYAQWMNHQQKFNPEIRKNLLSLLQKNSKQPDALAMLAMDAYQQKNYQQAIGYWQVLLTLVPANSEESGALRKAIAKAQRSLGHARGVTFSEE